MKKLIFYYGAVVILFFVHPVFADTGVNVPMNVESSTSTSKICINGQCNSITGSHTVTIQNTSPQPQAIEKIIQIVVTATPLPTPVPTVVYRVFYSIPTLTPTMAPIPTKSEIPPLTPTKKADQNVLQQHATLLQVAMKVTQGIFRFYHLQSINEFLQNIFRYYHII